MDSWRPIETAPKDGTWVLAWFPVCYDGGTHVAAANYVGGKWYLEQWDDWGQVEAGGFTHWMLLPAPPEDTHPVMPEIADRDCSFHRPADAIEGDMS